MGNHNLATGKAYWIEALKLNLLSCTRLDEYGITTIFANQSCVIKDRRRNGAVNGKLRKRSIDGLFGARLVPPPRRFKMASIAKQYPVPTHNDNLWHLRLGYSNRSVLEQMTKKKEYGMRSTDRADTTACTTCVTAKQNKSPSNGKLVKKSPETTIHLDIMGPMPTESLGRKRYCLTMITTSHRYVRVDLLRKKEEAGAYILNYVAWVNRNARQNTKRVHCDNAPEFITLRKDLEKLGIELTTSSPRTPESNGLAERTNRTLMEKARSMIPFAGLPKQYWGEAVSQAAYIHNRLQSGASGNKSPYKAMFGKIPNNSMIKIFGCRASVHKHQAQRSNKLDARASYGVYTGSQGGTHRVYLSNQRRLIESKNGKCDETNFLFRKFVRCQEEYQVPQEYVEIDALSDHSTEEEEHIECASTSRTSSTTELCGEDHTIADGPRRSKRIRKLPRRLILNALSRTYDDNEPRVKDALKREDSEHWEEAMQSEMKALNSIRCWDCVPRPKDKPVLHTKGEPLALSEERAQLGLPQDKS